MVEKGRPWMRWHVTRWRNSPHVLQMSLAAQGAYRNLLDAAWQQGCRLPNLPALLWKYALAQSPEEFATLAPQVMPMFTVSDDGQWLTNETLTEECAGRVEFSEELSRKRSEAGRKGNAVRWGAESSQDDRKAVAKPDLRSPSLLPASELIANGSHKREEKIREEKKVNGPDPDKSIEVAHWKCVDLGLASPRWSRPNDALVAFDAALQAEHRAVPQRPLTELADEMGALWLEYTRTAKGSGQYAMGPAKFFGEGWYRRAAAWRDQQQEPASLDGAGFIEEKRKKRAASVKSPQMHAEKR
jgi:uncharacterized protein YdaU (DUF1376 family)